MGALSPNVFMGDCVLKQISGSQLKAVNFLRKFFGLVGKRVLGSNSCGTEKLQVKVPYERSEKLANLTTCTFVFRSGTKLESRI